MGKRVFIYKRFERFWHWAQALLIILLGVTGFEIHGAFSLLGFGRAVAVHNELAATFIVLIAFAIFWHFTTGEWRQYIPTLNNLPAMFRFYMVGIFRGEPHPVKKTELSKLNPLQRLTYLGLKLLIIPLQVISGGIYYYYNELVTVWGLNQCVGNIAVLHTVGAFALVIFLIVHIYLTTTGHTVLSNIKAMVTGWEELEETGGEGP